MAGGFQTTDRVVEWGEGQRVGAGARGAHLDARGDVIDNADRLGVCKTRQRVRDEVKLHLPRWLCPCLLSVDGFAGGALQAAILRQVRCCEVPGGPTGSPPTAHLTARPPPTARQPTLWPTLLPLEYIATRQSRWYMCPQRPRRPTSSGRTLLFRSTPS